MHFQSKFPQGKLIRVLKGKVLDVAVDIRKNSETFGSHFCLELSGEDILQFWVPEGFAHGFLSLMTKPILNINVLIITTKSMKILFIGMILI